MKYRYLFIDADDTIFDYGRAESVSLLDTLDESNIKCGQEQAVSAYRRINDIVWKQFEKGLITLDYLRTERFRQLLRECGTKDPSDELCKRISGTYLGKLGSSAYMLDGAREMLERMGKICALVLITNGISSVQRQRLAKAGIEKYFSEIVISEEIGFKKPEKAFFDFAMKKCGSPRPGEVLVIGDSLTSDIQGGVNYGLDTCWFNPAGKPNTAGIRPAHEIASFEELYRIVEN